jgi:hypothetical protein
VPIAQVAHLAQLWYGKHADRGWEKWSVARARKIWKGRPDGTILGT